jgi:hypothetical protein
LKIKRRKMTLTFKELCNYFKTDRFVFDVTTKVDVETAFDVLRRRDETDVLVVFKNVK